MAKQKKRRVADYSTEEMVALCGLKTASTFENKKNKVFERYGIDSDLFKMDPGVKTGGENFYPVGCAELLAILIRNWDKNPSSRKNANRDNVTVTQICEFYRAVLDDVDNLPEELKGLIYKCCQSHFTTKSLVIWAERVVKGLALFTETHMDQPQENIGKLCQALSVQLDKMTYMEYLNNKVLLALPWINKFGLFPNSYNMNHEISISTQNIGLDIGIAEMIKQLACTMDNVKEELQYSMTDEESDVNAARKEAYQEIKSIYVSSEMEEYTTNTYSNGAKGWKNWAEKIKSGELSDKMALVRYYEEQIAQRELDLQTLRKELEAIENDDPSIFPITAGELEDINDAYVEFFEERYDQQTSSQRYADQYVGQMLWSFLTQEK